ncbi:MAG: aldose epimerase [Bacteroidota bacterium]
MFDVREDRDQYRYYCLEDHASGARVKITPARGGIVTGFALFGRELLYLDEDTYYDANVNVRGGIPVLFPICGQLDDGRYQWAGHDYRMKAHGFARDVPWEVISTGTRERASITLALRSDERTKVVYPFDFELRFEYSLIGNQLRIIQEYTNHSDQTMPFYAGLHPYFRVADKRRLAFEIDGATMFDGDDMMIKPFRNDLDLTDAVKAKVILDQTATRVGLRDLVTGKHIQMDYSREFKYPVLWSVPGKDFVCLELFMARSRAFNTRQDLYLLEPDSKVRLYVTISVAL